MATHLVNLPCDVLLHVMQYLEPHDLCVLATLSTTLAEVSRADDLWRRFCHVDDEEGDGVGDGVEGLPDKMKERYMSWLRPRLQHYAHYGPSPVPRDKLVVDDQLRVILLGDFGVGKTSLHTCLIRDMGDLDGQGQFALKGFNVRGFNITLHVWDTGGQERSGSLPTEYFRSVHAAVVIYDITNRRSLSSASAWAQELRKHRASAGGRGVEQGVPVVLVGMKSDMEAERKVSQDAGIKMAAKLGAIAWQEMSCKMATPGEARSLLAPLAETLLRELNPFSGTQGWHTPDDALLRALYQGRAHHQAQRQKDSSCVLQ